MGFIRRAAVAGQFYQDKTDTLRSTINAFLEHATPSRDDVPKALVAPHAGFVYSGPIAASAYATLTPAHRKISRVVLLGPCHRVAVQGIALSGASAFETPLGNVDIDQDACARIEDLAHVHVFDATHEREHSLEVHLPFLQVLLDDFKVVPLVVGDATPEQVAEVLDVLWGGDETLIVVSSDLSHYLDYESARILDEKTSRAIASLNASAIEKNGACGRYPLSGLLHVAKQRGMTVETLDVRNSGDTAGSKDRVVGYGSWAFYEAQETKPLPAAAPQPKRTAQITLKPVAAQPTESKQESTASKQETKKALPTKPRATATIKLQPLSKPKAPTPAEHTEKTSLTNAAQTGPDRDQEQPNDQPQSAPTPPINEVDFEQQTKQLLTKHGVDLLLMSALSIDHGLANQQAYPVKLAEHPEPLRELGASFVTLKKDGNLRGCIGSPQAYRPLIEDVSENAYRAAFEDPRFPKLEAGERTHIEISVSVLSHQTPIEFNSEDELLTQLRAGTDGLVIEDGAMRALFLPSVWNQLPRRQDFLRRLKVKAGMPPNYWSERIRAWRFIAAETSGLDIA